MPPDILTASAQLRLFGARIHTQILPQTSHVIGPLPSVRVSSRAAAPSRPDGVFPQLQQLQEEAARVRLACLASGGAGGHAWVDKYYVAPAWVTACAAARALHRLSSCLVT